MRSPLNYFLRRVAAYLIDGLILYLGVVAFPAALYFTGWHPFRAEISAGLWPSGWPLHLWVFLSTSVPFWFYYALHHSGPHQATLGKHLLGLKVTRLNGGRLSFARALLRAILTLVPFEINHFVILQLAPTVGSDPSTLFWVSLGGVYALIILYVGGLWFSPRRQSLPDFFSGSIVITH